MDIVLTIMASMLMLVGFLVICRTTSEYEDEDEDEGEEMAEDTDHVAGPEPRSKDAEP